MIEEFALPRRLSRQCQVLDRSRRRFMKNSKTRPLQEQIDSFREILAHGAAWALMMTASDPLEQ